MFIINNIKNIFKFKNIFKLKNIKFILPLIFILIKLLILLNISLLNYFYSLISIFNLSFDCVEYSNIDLLLSGSIFPLGLSFTIKRTIKGNFRTKDTSIEEIKVLSSCSENSYESSGNKLSKFSIKFILLNLLIIRFICSFIIGMDFSLLYSLNLFSITFDPLIIDMTIEEYEK